MVCVVGMVQRVSVISVCSRSALCEEVLAKIAFLRVSYLYHLEFYESHLQLKGKPFPLGPLAVDPS
jgi:hypothetical protein